MGNFYPEVVRQVLGKKSIFPKISIDNYKIGCISGQKALIIHKLACTECIYSLSSNLAHLLHYYNGG
jgi:hypothetical protein